MQRRYGGNGSEWLYYVPSIQDQLELGVPVPKRGYIGGEDSASIDTSTGGGALQFAHSVVLNASVRRT